MIREDQLAEGLAFLCAAVGIAQADAPAADAAAGAALAAVWAPELEEAAREAYSRDYKAFGFAPWRA